MSAEAVGSRRRWHRPARGDVRGRTRRRGQPSVDGPYGANDQAFIKYRIGDTNLYVEFWIKNALSFADARCIILKEGRVYDTGPNVYSSSWV